MKKNETAATVATAADIAANPAANPAVAVSADNAASANIAALPYDPASDTDGPAHKYRKEAANVPCAARTFRLTGIGAETATTGVGKSGKPTVMALVCVAAKAAGATQTRGVTGLAIVMAMRDNAALRYEATKAGKYAPGTKLPCPAWCSGYVTGAARSAHGLLAAI